MAGKLRETCEYWGARLSLGLIMRCPPKVICKYASVLGTLAFFFLRNRRKTAVDNILKAGVATDLKRAKQIARASFQSMGLTTAESFLTPRFLNDPIKKKEMVSFSIPAKAHEALKSNEYGVILVSGHLGNWEFGAQMVTRYRPLTGIARNMNNRRVQELIDKYKMRSDFETIEKHLVNPMQPIRVLQKKRALAILTDQHAHGRSADVIDFFGRPASTYTTPAVLQRFTGAPILFVLCVRTGFMKFHVEFSEPIVEDFTRENSVEKTHQITQTLAKMLEDAIRKYPEQYLWAHRRWKYAEKNIK